MARNWSQYSWSENTGTYHSQEKTILSICNITSIISKVICVMNLNPSWRGLRYVGTCSPANSAHHFNAACITLSFSILLLLKDSLGS